MVVPSKVVIWVPRKLGNALLSLSALALLRKNCQQAEFSVVCHPALSQVFQDQPWVSEVIEDRSKSRGYFAGTWALMRQLRRRRFDLGVALHDAGRCALVFKLAGIRRIIGFAGTGRGFLLDYARTYDPAMHRANSYAMLINEYFGRPDRLLPAPKLHFTALPTPLFRQVKPMIGLHLSGASKGARAYPKPQAIALIARLAAHHDCNIVLVGDETERLDAPEYTMAAGNGANFLDLRGKTDLKTLINTVAALDLLVAIDSSIMHLAAAVGTPFIVLQGRSHAPFDLVRPKVGFGVYLDRGHEFISETEKISAIRVEDVLAAVNACLGFGPSTNVTPPVMQQKAS